MAILLVNTEGWCKSMNKDRKWRTQAEHFFLYFVRTKPMIGVKMPWVSTYFFLYCLVWRGKIKSLSATGKDRRAHEAGNWSSLSLVILMGPHSLPFDSLRKISAAILSAVPFFTPTSNFTRSNPAFHLVLPIKKRLVKCLMLYADVKLNEKWIMSN